MKRTFILRKPIILLSICCLTLIFNATAQQTKKISLQGFLKDANGKAVADGQQSITFKLYTVAAGGTAQWTDTQTINVFGGVYSTHLGSVTNPLDNLDWGVATYFVGVTVQGVELTPRTELTFAPYSLGSPRATVADTARFVDTAKFVSCSGAVGDVKYSILSPTQFAAVNGSCWVPMDGRALVATDKLRIITGMATLPNAGGLFFRAQEFSNSPNNDPDRTTATAIATLQSDDFKSHTHTLNIDYGGGHAHSFYVDKSFEDGDKGNSFYPNPWPDNDGTQTFGDSSNGAHSHTGTNTPTGGAETRPKNLNLYVYIRIN